MQNNQWCTGLDAIVKHMWHSVYFVIYGIVENFSCKIYMHFSIYFFTIKRKNIL